MSTELNWKDSLITQTGRTPGELLYLAFNAALKDARKYRVQAEGINDHDSYMHYFKMECAYEYLINQSERIMEKERE